MEKFNLTGSKLGRELPSRDQKSRGFRTSRNNFNKTSQSQLIEDHPLQINLLNLQVDEQQFLSNSKIEVMQLQEHINRLDVDQRIRQAGENSLEHNNVKECRRFLNRFAGVNAHQVLEHRMKAELNETELLTFLAVDTPIDAAKKLMRVLQIVDVVVQKVTEQQLVFLLKYDGLFNTLAQGKGNGNRSNSKWSQLAQGVHLGRFHAMGANLERQEELFALASKLHAIATNTEDIHSKQSVVHSNSKVRQIATLEELQGALNTDLFDNLDRVQITKIDEILSQAADSQVLQTQKIDKQAQDIQILTEKVTKLKKQIENQETSLNTTRTGFFQQNDESDADYYHKIVVDIEDQYKKLIQSLEEQNQKLSLENSDLKNNNDALMKQMKQSKDDLLMQIEEKEKIIQEIKKPYETSNEFDDKFEDALRESFEKQKTCFEQKLDEKIQEIEQLQKKKNIEVYDLKQEISRISETKRLLMKKLSLFIKI